MFKPRIVPALTLAAALASAAAQAEDYRFELGLSFDRVSPDIDDGSDIDVIGAFGTFYLAPVRTDGLPLAEAAFLGRSSFVNANAVRLDSGDDNFDVFSANFGYYVPNTIFYGRIGVTKLDDLDAGDDTNVNGTFGITPFEGLLVTTDFDEDGWDPNAAARYVGKFGNDHYYAARISMVDPDDDDIDVGLEFDYFLDHTFSLGAGLDSDTFLVRGEKFFTPGFALGVRAYTGDDDTGDGLGATVRWRF